MRNSIDIHVRYLIRHIGNTEGVVTRALSINMMHGLGGIPVYSHHGAGIPGASRMVKDAIGAMVGARTGGKHEKLY